MTEVLNHAHVEVYKPSNDSDDTFDLFVPGDDLAGANFSDRINRRKDTGKVVLHNDHGDYSTGDPRIDSGDRLKIYVALKNDSLRYPEGENIGGNFGEGGYGGVRHRWEAMVRDVEHDYQSPNRSLMTLSCEDFVFGVMSMRTVFNAYEDTDISGHSEAILNEVVRHNAPEIDRSKIKDVNTVTSATFDGTDLLEVAISLTRRADAVMKARKQHLVFEPLSDRTGTPRFTFAGDDLGAFTSSFKDAGVANQIRVDGGVDRAIDDEQLTQDGWETVTESNRLTFRASTRKSNLNRIELWTDPRRTDSDEAVIVRLQKDDGGAPVAIGDTESDIDSSQLDAAFLAHDDFTTFIFGRNHTLPEPNPWVIVESDGAAGQDIGVDTSQTSASGDPLAAYKAWFEYQISVRRTDPDSVDNYRERDHRFTRDNIETLEEALDVAQEKINHDAVPEQVVEASGETLRAHELRSGDVVDLGYARERAEGEYIVTERTDDYNGVELRTDLKFTEVTTV